MARVLMPIRTGRHRRWLWQRLAELLAADCVRHRRDGSVRIFAREFLGIGTGLPLWCAIGITFESDSGHSDDRTFGKPLFQNVILRLALSQSDSPTIVMDDDGDVIQVSNYFTHSLAASSSASGVGSPRSLAKRALTVSLPRGSACDRISFQNALAEILPVIHLPWPTSSYSPVLR